MPGTKTIGVIRGIVHKISQLSAAIAILFLLGMMFVIVVDVFLRFVFRAPILGSVELVEFFMPIAGFLAMAWCAQNKGHVFVGVIVDRLPPRAQAILDSITLFLGLTLVPFVVWQSFAQARYKQIAHTSSNILKIPYYPFYIVVGVGYAILFLVLIFLLVENIKKAAGNES